MTAGRQAFFMPDVAGGAAPAAPGWRYCFALPDLWRPMGGQAVIYDIAAGLARAGQDAVLVHGGARHRYPFAEAGCPIEHLPALARVRTRHQLHIRLTRAKARLRERWVNPATPRFRPGPRDVFLVPEFIYREFAALLPAEAPLVLVVQDPTALLRAYSEDAAGLHARFASVLATSEAAAEAVRLLFGREAHRLVLPVARPGLDPAHPKTLQIAYMPRKLRPQSQRVTATLRRRPALAGVPIVAIENVSNAERDRLLNESLIFLSFSNMEGFGLPPAEAMAAGCLVVGYTGIGGNEYFTQETGFVIESNDMLRFVARIEEIVTAYRQDPAPLDRRRAQAAAIIAARYSVASARQSLERALAGMQADLAAGVPR